jgi:prepilin-type N-terminal cleavage/methylation domain-containing protein
MNNNVSGFTLIEVIAALGIVAVTFSIIISFESYLMTTTKRGSHRIQSAWAMTNYLYECHGKPSKEFEKDPSKKLTKKIDKPELTLTYQQKPIAEGSDLDELENLILETVDAEWKNQQGATRSDRIINVRFKMQETKPKEQGQ